MKHNIGELVNGYRQSIQFAYEFFISHGDEFFQRLPWFKEVVLRNKGQKLGHDAGQVEFMARFTAFFILHLPNICLTESEEVKAIILSHAAEKEVIPPLKSFFTPLTAIVEEVNRLADMDFEFDHSVLLKASLETLRGNFLKQFMMANKLVTTKGEEITLLNYLIRGSLELPAVDLSHLQLQDVICSAENLHQFTEAVRNANVNPNNRFKPFVRGTFGQPELSRRSSEAGQIVDFLTTNRLDIISFEKLICRKTGQAKTLKKEFLMQHKDLIGMICPLYFERNVRHLISREQGRFAYQHVQRKFNYQFEKS